MYHSSHKHFTRTISSLAVAVTLFSSPSQVMLASSEVAPHTTGAPLSLDEVVSYLVSRNDERYRRLSHSRATRVYHLSYRGIAGTFDAEMAVEAFYDSPSIKYFTIISESGPKIIVDRVLKKLLESEAEAALPEVRARTLLNRDNYNFTLIGYDGHANQYLLQVSPKKKSKYVYAGQIWVDGKDFAVTRIQAEPAQNPSFWTKKSEICQLYARMQEFWLPVRNESRSDIRLGGRAILTIDYKNYRLTETADRSAVSAAN